MDKDDNRIHERHLADLAAGEALQVKVTPKDTTLNRFVIEVETPGKTGVVSSARREERIFSASAAMRFVRDWFGHRTATVHLQPKNEEGERND